MAVLAVDALSTVRCDDCAASRVIVTEREDEGVRVTVLGGCTLCEGSTLHVGCA